MKSGRIGVKRLEGKKVIKKRTGREGGKDGLGGKGVIGSKGRMERKKG